MYQDLLPDWVWELVYLVVSAALNLLAAVSLMVFVLVAVLVVAQEAWVAVVRFLALYVVFVAGPTVASLGFVAVKVAVQVVVVIAGDFAASYPCLSLPLS